MTQTPTTRPPLNFAVIAGSFGGCGLVRFMPGTVGSVAAAGIAVALLYALPGHIPHLWFVLAGVSCVASLVAGVAILKLPGVKDPGWFVLDEVAAVFLTCGLTGAGSLLEICAGLLIFRVYDIAKPWPVRVFERLPGSVGILADDLVAAVFAAATLNVARAAIMGA